MALAKMTLYAYSDDVFRSEVGKFVLQVNPSTLKYQKGVNYNKKKPLGVQFQSPGYSNHEYITLSFDTLLDGTGVLDGPLDIPQQINQLESLLYNMNGDKHQPNYIKANWGSFIFNGVLQTLNYEYTLFAPNGQPLRVKISFILMGFMDKLQAAKKENKLSPDLSRIIVIKSGETVLHWCNEIYGDPGYCLEVARANKLSGFRNVSPGTRILFPPLRR